MINMETKYLTQLTITNSRNDDERFEWFITTDLEEQQAWIREKQDEQRDWNYETPGAVSFRYYSYDHFTSETILDVPINELKGLRLGELLQIIK